MSSGPAKTRAQLEASDVLRRENALKSLNEQERKLSLVLGEMNGTVERLLDGPYGPSRKRALSQLFRAGDDWMIPDEHALVLALADDDDYWRAILAWAHAEWDIAMASDEVIAAVDPSTPSGELLSRVPMGLSVEAAQRQRVGQTVIGPARSRLMALRKKHAAGDLSVDEFSVEQESIEREIAAARLDGIEPAARGRGRPFTVAAALSVALMEPLLRSGFGNDRDATIGKAIDYAQALNSFFYVHRCQQRHKRRATPPRQIECTVNSLRAAATAIRKRLA